jgi:hypothetical protein
LIGEHRVQDPLGNVAETEVGGSAGEHELLLNCIRRYAPPNADEVLVGFAMVGVRRNGPGHYSSVPGLLVRLIPGRLRLGYGVDVIYVLEVRAAERRGDTVYRLGLSAGRAVSHALPNLDFGKHEAPAFLVSV